MAKSFSEFDLELLGYSDVEEVGPKSDVFRIFRAIASAGVQTVEHHFIYLKDKAFEQGEVAAALKDARPFKNLHVVHPDSAQIPRANLDQLRGVPIYSHSALIWQRLERTFKDYRASILESVPQEAYLIPQRYANAGEDPHADIRVDVVAFLGNQPTKKASVSFPREHLIVVKAPAGVGKTTLTRSVVRELATTEELRVIPVYVEASHWGKLRLQSITDIWEVIQNSLATFGGGLALRKELFEYALRQGWMCFIFDGLDELCAQRLSHFNVNEVLRDLVRLVRESDAKVVLTTRSLFWDAEVSSVPSNVTILELAAFTKPQALKYFERRFENRDDYRNRARAIYQSLIQHTHTPLTGGGSRAQLVNTPMCVSMVAEFVEQGKDTITGTQGATFLDEILLGLCERDRNRQKFATAPSVQIQAFVELAVDDMDEFDSGDLEALGFLSEDTAKGRTFDHALLTSASLSRYRMRYEFLPAYFKAVFLKTSLLADLSHMSNSARRLVVQESNGRGFVLEHLVQLLPPSCLDSFAEKAKLISGGDDDLRMFMFHLLRLLLDVERPKETARERARFLIANVLNGTLSSENHAVVSRKILSGPLERLDLRNVTFDNCTLRDVAFTRCIVDGSTVFAKCIFRGEFTVGGANTGWRQVRLDKPDAELPASLILGEVVGTERMDRSAIALDAIRVGLGKFWHHGQLRRSIRREDWNRGLLASTGMADLVLEALRKTQVVEVHEISGLSDKGLGIPTTAVPDLKQFMDNGQITGRIKRAHELLTASIE